MCIRDRIVGERGARGAQVEVAQAVVRDDVRERDPQQIPEQGGGSENHSRRQSETVIGKAADPERHQDEAERARHPDQEERIGQRRQHRGEGQSTPADATATVP